MTSGRRRLNQWVPPVQKLSRLSVFVWFELFLNPMLVSHRGRRLLSAHIRAMCKINLRAVGDPDQRALLTPGYELGCKRVLISSDYYRALDEPHVEAEDSPIAKVTATGVVTETGEEYAADTIIVATGFRSHDFVLPMRITGLAGLELQQIWRAGAHAHLGLSVTGFPNFFLMYGPNTNVGSGSVVHMLESQIAHIVQAARTLRATGAAYLDVTPEAMTASAGAVQRRIAGTVWNRGGCTSWYQDESGRNSSNWPGYMLGYRLRTRRLNPGHYRLTHLPGASRPRGS